MKPASVFGWGAVARLGLVQAAIGAIVVLTTSTLNRVMVVELALPALVPGLLVAIHYAVQLTRPRMGFGSDVGGRRTPWIVGGLAVLALLVGIPMGFILGVTVVRRDTWERVPAEVRPRLLEVARALGERVDAEVRRLNADALEAMRRQGLQVVAVDPEAWRPAMERSWTVLRGGVVPAPFFDEVLAARDACRAGR